MDAETKHDIETLIDSGSVGRYQVAVLVMCGLIAMLDGFDTQCIAFIAPAVAADWGLAIGLFGPVFGIGLIGGLIGALGFGLAADKLGRKPGLLFSIALFGVVSILTPLAHDLNELIVFRFVTGLGLGGALPSIIALTSEYAPKRLRATFVTLMFCGFPLGAAIGAGASAALIPALGWPAVLILGGIIPLVLLPFVAWIVPESVRYLGARGRLDSVARIVDRMRLRNDWTGSLGPAAAPEQRSPVGSLFADGRAPGTLLLWVIFFLSLLMTFFLINWIPSIATQTGVALKGGVIAVGLLNLGSIFGCILLGRMVDKYGPYAVIGIGYGVGAVAIGTIGFAGAFLPAILAAAFIAGFFSIGAQMCAVALAATYYPTHFRATGIGWSMGFGRVGAIVGPVAGGVLIGAGLQSGSLFAIVALTSLLAAGSVFLMGRLVRTA